MPELFAAEGAFRNEIALALDDEFRTDSHLTDALGWLVLYNKHPTCCGSPACCS